MSFQLISTSAIEWYVIFILLVVFAFICYLEYKNKIYFGKKQSYLMLLAISFLVFVKILADVLSQGAITRLDFLVSEKIISFWQPSLSSAVIYFVQITNFLGVVMFTFLLLFFIQNKKYNKFALLAFGFVFSLFSEVLIKRLFQIERPIESLIELFDYGFPSGHVTVATTTAFLIYFIFERSIKQKSSKKIFALTLFLVLILIAFSRVYLNVHTLSEVLAGFALGTFISSALILIFEKLKISIKS